MAHSEAHTEAHTEAHPAGSHTGTATLDLSELGLDKDVEDIIVDDDELDLGSEVSQISVLSERERCC